MSVCLLVLFGLGANSYFLWLRQVAVVFDVEFDALERLPCICYPCQAHFVWPRCRAVYQNELPMDHILDHHNLHRKTS